MPTTETHTPGPWIFDPKNTGRDFQIGYGICPSGSGFTIAHIPLRGEDGIAEANCRLIAAAPELLSALLDAERFMSALIEMWQADMREDHERGMARFNSGGFVEAIKNARAVVAKVNGR